MNQFLIIFALVGLLIGIVTETTAFETICSASEDVELDYTINDGKVLEMCIDDLLLTVFMTVESDTDSQITVEIPRTVVYFVNQDCKSYDLIILVNNEQVDYNVENTPFSRIITLDFATGYNVIEFIGSYTLGDDVHQYCSVIYGYDSQYLPPEIQLEKGRPPEHVRCNEGLELVVRDNVPACVSDLTPEKLATSEYDGVYDLKFIGEDESQKFVVKEIITIQNGELVGKAMFAATQEYSGFVDVDSRVFLFGPCIDSKDRILAGEGYFSLGTFDENNVATGEVGCEPGISRIVSGTWILAPTGGNNEEFILVGTAGEPPQTNGVDAHEPGGDYTDEGLFYHERALRDMAEAEQTTDPELQKSLYLRVEQDLRGAWIILGNDPEIFEELRLVRQIIKEKYPDYPLLITEELTKIDEGEFPSDDYTLSSATATYAAIFVLVIPIAGILFGLWLYKHRKKQGKNPLIGTIIFGVSINVIIIFLILVWSIS